MMNICSTCQGAQSECQERLDANADYRSQINGNLADEGLSYEKRPLTNKNLLWLLVEEIGLDTLRVQGQAATDRAEGRPVLRLLHRAPGRAARDRRGAPP